MSFRFVSRKMPGAIWIEGDMVNHKGGVIV
jgi:hypothetical protein